MGSQITALSQSELPMIKLIKADALKSCKMASLLAGKRSSCTEKNILKSNELKRYWPTLLAFVQSRFCVTNKKYDTLCKWK